MDHQFFLKETKTGADERVQLRNLIMSHAENQSVGRLVANSSGGGLSPNKLPPYEICPDGSVVFKPKTCAEWDRS